MQKLLQYAYEYALCRTPERSELEYSILCLQGLLGTLIDQSQIERIQRFFLKFTVFRQGLMCPPHSDYTI